MKVLKFSLLSFLAIISFANIKAGDFAYLDEVRNDSNNAFQIIGRIHDGDPQFQVVEGTRLDCGQGCFVIGPKSTVKLAWWPIPWEMWGNRCQHIEFIKLPATNISDVINNSQHFALGKVICFLHETGGNLLFTKPCGSGWFEPNYATSVHGEKGKWRVTIVNPDDPKTWSISQISK